MCVNEFFHGERHRRSPEEQPAAGVVEGFDIGFGEAGAAEADGVEASHAVLAVDFDEWWDVVVDTGGAAEVGIVADRDVVMQADQTHHGDIVADVDVSGEHDVVGKDAVVTDLGIMADVAVDHEEVSASDAGEAVATGWFGADVDSDGFAEGVVVADFESSGTAAVFFVLRGGADDGVGEECVVLADGGSVQDGDVGDEFAAGPDADIGADHAEGADVDVGGQFGLGINDG